MDATKADIDRLTDDEMDKLFIAAVVIAANDSIGEGYGYMPDFEAEDFFDSYSSKDDYSDYVYAAYDLLAAVDCLEAATFKEE